MLKYTLEQISETLVCGEALHWDSTRKCMYFCDADNSKVFRYDPKSKELFDAKVDAPSVSVIIPVKGADDKFVVGVGRSIAIMIWDGVSKEIKKSDLQLLHTVEENKPNNRFNDGKCDSLGRLLIGTMGGNVNGLWEDGQASFYTFEKDGKKKSNFVDVGISNGLCWSADGKKLFYIDSLKYSIEEFDYNLETGEMSNRKVVFNLRQNNIEGCPDGMTIDTSGNLWVAVCNGSCVICVDPKTQKLLLKLPLPGKYITCVQFGGENLEDMYVTSASFQTNSDELKVTPYCGGTFIITGLGVKGCESFPAEL